MAMKQRSGNSAKLPTKDEILAFITENPENATKRDIARAFSIKGAARIELKQILRQLADDGLIEKHHRRISRSGALPPVFVARVADIDEDGELLVEPENWDAPSAPRLLLIVGKHGAVGPPGIGDRLLVRQDNGSDDGEQPRSARVIKKLERQQEFQFGCIKRRGEKFHIEPIERSRSAHILKNPPQNIKDGDLISYKPLRSGTEGLRQAEFIETVGSMSGKHAFSTIAVIQHDIPHIFPKDCLAAAQACHDVPPGDREDWCELPLITIDPADAKDHDDAVHASSDTDPDNKDGIIVTVAIADVAHFVTPESALDIEARKRGNSVYFPDRVVPMLPEVLSNGLCSLKAGEPRPALAVRMVFDKTGNKKHHSFHSIMMRSHAKLSYQMAQKAIEGFPDDETAPLLDTVLKPLWHAYKILQIARKYRNPLELDLPERKLILNDHSDVIRIEPVERLDAHRLIEEFMVSANVCAAETLEAEKYPLIYRAHDGPSAEKLNELSEFLQSIGIRFNASGLKRPKQLNNLLAAAAKTDNADVINEMMLRSQSQADYRTDNIGHFGLNLRRYAHFTSPIRRYADLTVHRALINSLGKGNPFRPDTTEHLAKVAETISITERRAMTAERETTDRLIAAFLADQTGATFSGKISGVIKAGFFVRLSDTGADGFVPASTLGAQYYVYDEPAKQLIGEKDGESFRIGDIVTVRLIEVSPIARALRFEMLTDGPKRKISSSRPTRTKRHSSRPNTRKRSRRP